MRSPYLLLRLAVGNYRQDLSFTSGLSVDSGNTFHPLHLRPDSQGRHFQSQRVPRDDRSAKPGRFYTGKKRDLAVTVFKLTKGEDRSDLSQCLDLQNARHDRRTGEMSYEELFVHCHLFDADDTCPRFKLDDLVDEQERVAVREDLLDRDRIENAHF